MGESNEDFSGEPDLDRGFGEEGQVPYEKLDASGKYRADLVKIFKDHLEDVFNEFGGAWDYAVKSVKSRIEIAAGTGERRRFINPDWSEGKKDAYTRLAEAYIRFSGKDVTIGDIYLYSVKED
jgi:hypothetical protein